MSIVMLNAYNSLGNKFNEFLKFLKIKHNDRLMNDFWKQCKIPK